MRRAQISALVLFLIPMLAACGGGSSGSSNGGPPPPPSSVTVTPASAKINKGGSQTFSAVVNGATDQSVFWEIAEATPKNGDTTHGFISNGGVYVAPAVLAVPPPSVTIQALALADPTKIGTAAVTLQAGSLTSVTVSPGPTQVAPFLSLQFMAAVTGNTNQAVTWQVNGVTGGGPMTGAISASGLFVAPNSVPVLSTGNNAGQTAEVVITAVSQADSTAMDSVLVTIVPPQQNAQAAPSPLGVSGGNANDKSGSGANTLCCGGTLGSLVSRGGNNYILSNNHVFARSDAAALGETIVQPGLIDNNCATPPTVATLSQFFSLEKGAPPNIDAALAQVNTGAIDPTGTILELGGANSNPPANGPPHAGSGVAPTVGRMVAKSGRSTGLTCSAIFAINTNTSVQYQKGCGTGSTFSTTYANQVDITNRGFSAEGDSGSLIVSQDTADPVGLLFAGGASDTLANPISDVVNGLADPAKPSSKPVFVGDSTPTGHAVAACSLPGPQSAIGARLAVQRKVASAGTLERAVTARDAHAAELMAHPEVQAVGVGASYDNPDASAILFFVTRGQARSNLPAEVGGIRTRIIEGDLFPVRGALSPADSAALEQAAAAPQLVYSISGGEVARAQVVHTAHAEELMKRPGVQGVGIGSSADAPGEAALVIFLIKGQAYDPIPVVIDGLRTRVRETERFRAGVRQIPPQRGCSVPAAEKTQPTSAGGSAAKR